jgi:hypothetical protein
MEMQSKNMEMMIQKRLLDRMEDIEDKQDRHEELKERHQMQRDLRLQELKAQAQPSLSPRYHQRSPLDRRPTEGS